MRPKTLEDPKSAAGELLLVFKRREKPQRVKPLLDTEHVNGKNQGPSGKRRDSSSQERVQQESPAGQGQLES